jgi:hypothetical protein
VVRNGHKTDAGKSTLMACISAGKGVMISRRMMRYANWSASSLTDHSVNSQLLMERAPTEISPISKRAPDQATDKERSDSTPFKRADQQRA